MFSFSPHTRVYLAKAATDMRKSFRGLLILTEAVLRQDPASGHLFVFLNRRRDLMKILYWENTGYVIWYKRLEQGKFQLPDSLATAQAAGVELPASQLSLILQGIDLRSVRQRLRYQGGPSSPVDRHPVRT
jgi:transposase